LDGNHTSFQTTGSGQNRPESTQIVEFAPSSIYSIPCPKWILFSRPMVLSIHVPASYTFSMFVCLSSSVFSRCDQALVSMRTIQRTHRSQPPTKNLTFPSTFEALPEQMASTRARAPVFRACRLSSWCVCVCERERERESVIERELHTA
jgi:hypothetical protein